MLKDLPWPRKAAGQGVRVAEIAQDLAANNRGLFAPPYSQLEIQGAELSSRGKRTTICGQFFDHS